MDTGAPGTVTRREWLHRISTIAPLATHGIPSFAAQEGGDWKPAVLFGLDPDPILREAHWITDLSRCSPGDALTPEPRSKRWQVVPYEARYRQREVSGKMLLAGPETMPPRVRCPLEARGWHAIYIGMKSFLGYGDVNAARFRLKQDPCDWLLSQTIGMQTGSQTVTARADWIRYQIQDCFWRCADVTGETIEIAQNNAGLVEPCAIAYIRLVPLTGDELAQLRQRQGAKGSGRLICMNDAFTFMYERRPTTREEIWEEIYSFRQTDYAAVYWCSARADNCLYPTKVGTIMQNVGADFPRVGDRYVAESMRTLLSRGIDPMGTALEFTHRCGMEFHTSIRVESFSAEPPWDRAFRSDFFVAHPELRCVDYDGRSIARMSYAMPEVQEHMLELIREILGYGVDGINLIFTRAQPYILYEKPVADEFRKRYSAPPTSFGERDPRLLDLRAEFMTAFLRRVRAELDKRPRTGRRLQLSAVVMANEDINRFHALDLRGWIREGLIDELSPGPFGMNREEPTPIEVPYFASLKAGTSCRLCPTLRPTLIKPDEVLRTVDIFYRQGATGFAIFDMNLFQRFPLEWGLWQQLARREELPSIMRSASVRHNLLQIVKLGGLVVDKYSPRWAY
jgi:hypothetical protein